MNIETSYCGKPSSFGTCIKRGRISLTPMRFVQQMSAENQYEIQTYRHVPKFVPAGQSTQMIIGATPESDYQILHVGRVVV